MYLIVRRLEAIMCYGEYTFDCKLKKFREMLLTTLEHNQHDVIDVPRV
jgi:hypothetical protein